MKRPSLNVSHCIDCAMTVPDHDCARGRGEGSEAEDEAAASAEQRGMAKSTGPVPDHTSDCIFRLARAVVALPAIRQCGAAAGEDGGIYRYLGSDECMLLGCRHAYMDGDHLERSGTYSAVQRSCSASPVGRAGTSVTGQSLAIGPYRTVLDQSPETGIYSSPVSYRDACKHELH